MDTRVTLFAWNHGLAIVEQVGTWNDYAVYLPKHTAASAAPTAILASDTEVRFAEADEAAACMSGIPA